MTKDDRSGQCVHEPGVTQAKHGLLTEVEMPPSDATILTPGVEK